LKRN